MITPEAWTPVIINIMQIRGRIPAKSIAKINQLMYL